MERARLSPSPPAVQGSLGVSVPCLYPIVAGCQGGPAALWMCFHVFSAEGRSSPAAKQRRVTGWSQYCPVHGPLKDPSAPLLGHQTPANPTLQHSLAANPMLPPVHPLHPHTSLPPFMLSPPTTVKQHQGLTNPSVPPGFSPQPTMCLHMSLLLPHPSQQQLTNRSVKGTALSQSGAAICKLCQLIRDSHTPLRGIKVPQWLASACV